MAKIRNDIHVPKELSGQKRNGYDPDNFRNTNAIAQRFRFYFVGWESFLSNFLPLVKALVTSKTPFITSQSIPKKFASAMSAALYVAHINRLKLDLCPSPEGVYKILRDRKLNSSAKRGRQNTVRQHSLCWRFVHGTPLHAITKFSVSLSLVVSEILWDFLHRSVLLDRFFCKVLSFGPLYDLYFDLYGRVYLLGRVRVLLMFRVCSI